MSLKIPTFESNVRRNEAPAAVPPQAAFGGEVAEAAARQGQAFALLGEKLAEHATKLQESLNQKAVLDVDKKFRIDMQNALSNKEKDADGKPKGIYTRRLGQAINSTIDFDKMFDDISKKHEETLVNGRQKELFRELAGSFKLTERESVLRHESTQTRESITESLKSNIEQRTSDVMRLSDPVLIGRLINETSGIAVENMKGQGMDEATANVTGMRVRGDMAQKSIASLLDKDYNQAKLVFETLKPKLGGEDVAAIEKMMKGTEQLVKRQQAWDAVKGLAGKDGLPDATAMLAQVDKLGLQPAEKEQMQDYFRSKINETTQLIHKKREAEDREFMNTLYTAKKNGATLDQAMKLVGNGRDAYDQGVKLAAVRTLYSSPKETNPQAYMDLWTGIQNNAVTREQLDREMKTGSISVSDWEGLSKEMYRVKIEGSSPVMKDAIERVKIMADKEFGSDKEKKAQFMYVLMAEARGKSPEEIIKTANDKLQKDPSSGWIFKSKRWESDLKRIDAENMAWGKVYQDLGQDQVMAIGKGVLAAGAKNWGINDIGVFAEKFGGYDNIKPGTETFKAITFLMQREDLVTSRNVEAVLKYWKDMSKLTVKQ